MKKVIILFILIASAVFAQRPADEKLASFTTADLVNSALVKANAAVTGSGTTNTLAYWTGTGSIGSLVTSVYPSPPELAYVKGVTSAIQTQLNGKASASHTHTIANVTGLQAALNNKQDALVSGTNIKTINSQSILGSGNLVISGTSDTTGTWLRTYNIVKSLIVGDMITGTAATLDSMIVDFRKNNYLRLNK